MEGQRTPYQTSLLQGGNPVFVRPVIAPATAVKTCATSTAHVPPACPKPSPLPWLLLRAYSATPRPPSTCRISFPCHVRSLCPRRYHQSRRGLGEPIVWSPLPLRDAPAAPTPQLPQPLLALIFCWVLTTLPGIPSQLPLSRTPAVWGGHEVRGGHSLALYPPLVGPAVPTGVRSLTLFSLPVPGCLS